MNRLLALGGLLIFLATVYINYLAGTGQINNIATGAVSGLYPTLFTPAGFTFSIWSVIYLLNLSFMALQVNAAFRKPESFNKRLVLLFTAVSIVNCIWIFCWHYDQLLASVFMMLSLLYFLIFAFKLTRKLEPKGVMNIVSRVNFSVYLGWISVATIANIAVYISHTDNIQWTRSHFIWTAIVIAVAAVLAVWMLLRFRSFAYAMVIGWALFGINRARGVDNSNFASDVAQVALIALVVVLVTGGYVFTQKMIRLRSN